MSVELVIPDVGESITEVEIVKWLKQEGDTVKKDEGVVELQTDKAAMELPAPVDGVLKGIKNKVGDVVAVGAIIGSIENGSGSAKSEAKSPPKQEAKKEELKPAAKEAPKTPTPKQAPAPKKEAKEESAKEEARPSNSQREEKVPMTPIRRYVADKLVQAQHNAALLTTFNEVDMGHVQELRKEYQESFQKKYGTKLGIMSFFVKAVIEALKNFPALNAEIQGHDIVYHNYFDIGIAIGLESKLVVPVLRDAERMSFSDIETTILDFSKRAKNNTLKSDDLRGGTFTITNGGVFGSLLSTPIVNPPQSGILGLHAIQERPVVRNGAIEIRPMMYIALTYDHRIIDGREAVLFLRSVKENIETPSRILLEL